MKPKVLSPGHHQEDFHNYFRKGREEVKGGYILEGGGYILENYVTGKNGGNPQTLKQEIFINNHTKIVYKDTKAALKKEPNNCCAFEMYFVS